MIVVKNLTPDKIGEQLIIEDIENDRYVEI